jgi:hypothetical protein
LSTSEKIYGLVFSELSIGVVIPILIGILILLFPTVIFDFLGTIKLNMPDFIWGGVEIPLQHILTVGIAEGILTCAVPIMLGIVWNRWAGGASGFLCSLLFVIGMEAYYGSLGIVSTLDWLGVIVAGMLIGYIAGSLYQRAVMRGKKGLKQMLLASIIAAIVAIIFVTQTFIWYSPMFSIGSYWDSVGFAYFTYGIIYGLWAIFAALGSWIASWFM